MPTAETVLAMMLLLQQPGRSPYSTILVPECDERCQQAPLCDEETLSCAPPAWSPRHQSFLRLETYGEGVRRYADIAAVIAAVSDGTSTWTGSKADLRRLLVTVAFHESGFRRDVHDGRTRGDCDYREVGGVLEAVPGSCRSHCLGQIFLRGDERTSRGHASDQLVGLDRASTTRCVQTIADRLAEANRACTAQRVGAGVHANCTLRHYGGVTSPGEDPRIRTRVRTFERLRQTKPSLPERARAALEPS